MQRRAAMSRKLGYGFLRQSLVKFCLLIGMFGRKWWGLEGEESAARAGTNFGYTSSIRGERALPISGWEGARGLRYSNQQTHLDGFVKTQQAQGDWTSQI